ncbi:MAG: YeeE/YedE thiosulfate transporter family protein [Cypionkella sp.]|nr:YeeE/YedE family protein [Cypionkella sp.]
MIGLAGSMFLLMNGKIMGITGILGGLLDRSGWSNAGERLAFVLGLIAVPPLLVPLYSSVSTHISSNWLVIVVGGFLVGLGARLANGCTSGHGVCGISRLSLRGTVATVFYIVSGGMTIALLRHVLGVI